MGSGSDTRAAKPVRGWHGAGLFLLLLLGALGPRPACVAQASDRIESVRVVVPYPITGPRDIHGGVRATRSHRMMARLGPRPLSDILADHVIGALARAGEPARAVRIAGEGTRRGARTVARAAADGRTLLLASDSTLLIEPLRFADAGYRPEEDFVVVEPLARMPFVLLAHAGIAPGSVKALLPWLAVRPGEINAGSSGDGSMGHVMLVRFARLTGTRPVHVGYNGGIDALGALARGQVSLMFAALPLALPYLDNGAFLPLGVAGAARARALPDVPTLSEAGVPGYAAEGWFAVLAPGRTPSPRLAALSAAIGTVTGEATFAARLLLLGLEPHPDTRRDFATRLHDAIVRFAPDVAATGTLGD